MDVIRAAKIIAGATLRPFTKNDYFGWDVGPIGPHEIGESGTYTIVRDGNNVELHHHITEETHCIQLTNL